jgi:proteasome accessory factor C
VGRHADGSIDLVLGVSSFASIRSWVLGLLDHVTVVEPMSFRDELLAWLDTVMAPPTSFSAEPRYPDDADATPAEEPAVRTAPGRETSRRLQRLLALVGWLAQVGESPIADAAQRFGMSEKELVAELELAACCGIPPYTPDTLMEIEVSEHAVRAFLPAEYARPRRLTPAEGFAVAASARLLLAVPGSEDDALRRALAKLDAALGSREAVGLDVDAPTHLAAIRDASDAHQALEIDYLSGSRDELTTRTVEPLQVATIDGHWYLDAYCHRAGDMRRFRVDRIGAVRPPAQSPAPAVTRERPLDEMFVPGPGAVEVHLQLGPGAQWVPESVPVRAARRDGDGTVTDVVLDVSGMAWFERLLVQLGPAVRVVSPPELTGLAAAAARRVRTRYEVDGADNVAP